MKEKLLDMKKVSEVLGVAPKTLYMWKWKKRHLPFVKIGGALRVSEKDLKDFIENRKRRPEENYK